MIKCWPCRSVEALLGGAYRSGGPYRLTIGGLQVSSCPKLPQCPFFNERLVKMPAIAEMAKDHYCRSGKYESCARYLVAKIFGSSAVPDNLYPDQRDRANSIIGASPGIAALPGSGHASK